MKKQKKLGQFNTTNSDYILQGFWGNIKDKIVCDPFAGNGDLLYWATKNGAKEVYGYDIDKTKINQYIVHNDSLIHIPNASFILTNPPYLGKNKMNNSMKNKYDLSFVGDLYLLSIIKIIETSPDEGILIVPVNFLSAENSSFVRKQFLDRYEITRINYFTEQVFADTTYNVISFYFKKIDKLLRFQKISIHIYPKNIIHKTLLFSDVNYRIAGKKIEYLSSAPKLDIERMTENTIDQNDGNINLYSFYVSKEQNKIFKINKNLNERIKNNIILLNCIDTNASKAGWIKAEDIRNLSHQCLVGKETSRNLAYILLPDFISISKQEQMIFNFNRILNEMRDQYQSLFLTNFRDNNRKRISFDFCYKLLSHCYHQIKNDAVA